MRCVIPLLILATSATAAVLDQTPVDSVVLRGDVAALAACAYTKLDASEGSGIKKIDLPNETRLAMEPSGTRYWQLTFRPAGAHQTRVEFTTVQTLFGPQPAPRVMPAVRSCAN